MVQVNGCAHLNQSTDAQVVVAGANPSWILLLQDSSWNQTYGGAENDYASAVIEHSGGGFIIGGSTSSFNQGLPDYWLIRTDATGDLLWTQSYGSIADDSHCDSVQLCPDGGCVMAGSTEKGYGPDGWLVRTDASGNHLWNRSYGGQYDDYFMDAAVLSNGGIALAGSTQSDGQSEEDAWLVRVDADGSPLWNHSFGGTGSDGFTSILALSNGFLLTGHTESSGAGSTDVFIVRTDLNGNQLWNHTYGGILQDAGYGSVLCSDSGFAIGASTSNFGAGDDDFWLIRTDASGNIQWNKTFGGTGEDTLASIALCDEGGFVLFGETRSYGAGDEDFWLVRTDYEGDIHWNLTFGGSGSDRGMDMVYSNDDDGFALTGYTDSYGAGGTDAWLVWLEDDPPPPPPVPGFPHESLLLGFIGAMGLCLFLRRRKKHPL